MYGHIGTQFIYDLSFRKYIASIDDNLWTNYNFKFTMQTNYCTRNGIRNKNQNKKRVLLFDAYKSVEIPKAEFLASRFFSCSEIKDSRS